MSNSIFDIRTKKIQLTSHLHSNAETLHDFVASQTDDMYANTFSSGPTTMSL